jgi:hypothetical protein
MFISSGMQGKIKAIDQKCNEFIIGINDALVYKNIITSNANFF